MRNSYNISVGNQKRINYFGGNEVKVKKKGKFIPVLNDLSTTP
jgi:hypothetical protein